MSKAGRFAACLAMVGVGAIAGTISGGNTNAARSPDAVPTGAIADGAPAFATPAAVQPVKAQSVNVQPANVQPATAQQNTTTVAMTGKRAPEAARNEPAPAAVIAMRFPTTWQQQRPAAPQVATDDNAPPPQALAYAGEPRSQSQEPVRPAAASASGYQLASIDPTPVPMPKPMAKPKPKTAVLFNDAQLASIKARLKLSRDQEQHWPAVEQALRAISWKLATKQTGNIRGGKAAMIDPSSPEVARLKSAAFPLIMSMREDQKREVRQLAHTMGLKQVASMF